MYKITRFQLNTSLTNIKKYILKNRKDGKKSLIIKAVNTIIRNNNYKLEWKNILTILNSNNIFFIDCKDKPIHWAETDGLKIWLSPLKEWNDHNLYYTLLHEALHGLIKRTLYSSHISELREHIIMLNLDKWLINNKKI